MGCACESEDPYTFWQDQSQWRRPGKNRIRFSHYHEITTRQEPLYVICSPFKTGI